MYNSQIQLNTGVSKSSFAQNISGFSMPKNIQSVESTEKPQFKDFLTEMSNNLNEEMNAPDKLLNDLVSGRNGVDVHDVMTAMSKAELTITVATTAVTKVIQAYDKISQIQV